MPYLIVGVDPGHTIGLAALDLEGRPCRVAHIQQGGFEAALAELESWGTPSLIAADVRPAPELVLKLASAFNAALYVPAQPWREEDKKKAVREVFERSSFAVENVHERDALSAAVQAWRHHQNLLRLPAQTGLSAGEAEFLRHLLLQGFRHDVALERIRRPKTGEAAPRAEPIRRPEKAFSPPIPAASAFRLQTLERTLVELRKSISLLEAERERLSHRIRLLENGVIERQRRDNVVRKMAAEIMRLRGSLKRVNERRQKEGAKSNPSRAPPALQAARLSSSASRPPVSKSPASISKPSSSPPSDEDLKDMDEPSEVEKVIEEYRRSRQKGARPD